MTWTENLHRHTVDTIDRTCMHYMVGWFPKVLNGVEIQWLDSNTEYQPTASLHTFCILWSFVIVLLEKQTRSNQLVSTLKNSQTFLIMMPLIMHKSLTLPLYFPTKRNWKCKGISWQMASRLINKPVNPKSYFLFEFALPSVCTFLTILTIPSIG